ncbi:MAG: Nicotinate-nucleotide--dimethylbenzimidazole phosphoribosyltransferase [Bacilli bacterium]|nr:Nicotinate-nucleotide--dimethylbenzimidazole phosphoribosyltransferase [Bacilli bacterium]
MMEEQIRAVCREIRPVWEAVGKEAQHRLDNLTKPLGSLGKLEPLLVQLSQITGLLVPVASPAATLIFAADHGVAAEGVSAYGAEVTEEMAVNIAMGTAMSSVLARACESRLWLVDVGVSTPVRHPNIVVRKAGLGTANFTEAQAMTLAQAEHSVLVGIETANEAIKCGARLVTLGEMGIGNTTTSAALAAVLCNKTVAEMVGAGTGISQSQQQKKRQVIREALLLHQPNPLDPWDLLVKIGGFEIAALTGAILACAAKQVPVLLDGFITGVAALLAACFNPLVKAYLIASHCSAETGHSAVLQELGLTACLDLNMRVGEGTGALMMLPILQNACKLMSEMATFEDARVSHPHQAHVGSELQQQQEAAGPETERQDPPTPTQSDFSAAERDAVYKAILARRDIRVYLPNPVPEQVLARILQAAHHGPSVGYMQPWNFILIDDRKIHQELFAVVDKEREAASIHYADDKRDYYLRLKLEGLLQAPLTICVTCDHMRGGPHVLGRNTIPETDLMSTSCAIENLWLAARTEGVAVGWISIYQMEDVRRILQIPAHVDPVALLTVGFTPYFPEIPVLERVGWGKRLKLPELVFYNQWDPKRVTGSL